MQACNISIDARLVIPLTPNITVLRTLGLTISPMLTQILSCAPLLRHVEVKSISCPISERTAPKALQALRSLPQSISWRPLDLCLREPHALSIVHEACAAFAGTPLAQAVSKLVLYDWMAESSIAALRASFPDVLHFELQYCNQITVSSLSEAVAAWPMLRSISITTYCSALLAEQQHLEAAARTAAELKAGQPFEIVLQVYYVGEGGAARMDALVAAIHNAF